MLELFVDTSFLIAAVNGRDRNHGAAAELQPQLETHSPVLTNHVLGESWTFARRRFGHRAAVSLVDALVGGDRYTVLEAGGEVERSALAWLRDHDEREYSYVDATSFAVMRERGILDALAFDADFHAAGFRTLQP